VGQTDNCDLFNCSEYGKYIALHKDGAITYSTFDYFPMTASYAWYDTGVYEITDFEINFNMLRGRFIYDTFNMNAIHSNSQDRVTDSSYLRDVKFSANIDFSLSHRVRMHCDFFN